MCSGVEWSGRIFKLGAERTCFQWIINKRLTIETTYNEYVDPSGSYVV
jgi:hypothetical protein